MDDPDPPPPPPQPNIGLLSQHFCSAVDEIKNFRNIPAIAGGDRILAEIQQMRQEIRDQSARLEQRITDLDGRITDLDGRVTANHRNLVGLITSSNWNNTARVQNSFVSSPWEPLSPFFDPSTRTVVLGFPRTSADLEQMNEQAAGALLGLLGVGQAAIGANMAEKKRQLRAFIGLKAQPA